MYKHILLFIGSIISFLVLIFYLQQNILYKNIKGVTSVQRNLINHSLSNSELNHYFEPTSRTSFKVKPGWLNTYVVNHINYDTLNEPNNFPLRKIPGTYRIITLGDSFVFGLFVDTANNFSKVLEAYLNQTLKCSGIKKFEVLNLGVWGYDIEYPIHRFYLRGQKYSPNLVIWYLADWNFNTVNEVMLPLRNKLKTTISYKIRSLFMTEQQRETMVAMKALEMQQKIYGIDDITNYQRRVLNDFSLKYHNPVLFLHPKLNSNYEDILNEISNRNPEFQHRLSAVDIKQNNDLSLQDGHPSIKGHHAIANELFKIVTEEYLSKCNTNN